MTEICLNDSWLNLTLKSNFRTSWLVVAALLCKHNRQSPLLIQSSADSCSHQRTCWELIECQVLSILLELHAAFLQKALKAVTYRCNQNSLKFPTGTCKIHTVSFWIHHTHTVPSDRSVAALTFPHADFCSRGDFNVQFSDQCVVCACNNTFLNYLLFVLYLCSTADFY